MHEIQKSLAGLALGAPQLYRNLALFPLVATDDSPPDYVLLDEALARGLARVTEVSAAGSVPELAFENASARKILLVDGDELSGARQNRVLNLSILVGGGRKVVIPVSCVEQGRWAYRKGPQAADFQAAERSLFASARARKMARVSESLRRSGERASDQGEIWADVACKVSFLRAEAPTGAMADAYAAASGAMQDYLGAFHVVPLQRGAVVAVDGRVAGLEVFDSAAVFARYLPKLVRSYAMDAIETAGGPGLAPTEAAVKAFIEDMQAAVTERFAALGEGEDIRLSGSGLAGGALTEGGRVVHLAAHAVAA